MRSGSAPSPWALVAGVVLLVVGGGFLLRNAGVIDIDWGVIWPALVIAVGVALIVGALLARDRSAGSGEASAMVPVEGATQLDLTLRVGAGTYLLRGGAQGLVEVSADEPTIDARVDRTGGTARVRLATAVDSWGWGRYRGTTWRIGVHPDMPMALDVQAGAGRFDLDLSAVAVERAKIGIGAADLRVVLPRPHGDVPIRVDGGAASFTFAIPAGVEARVTASGLITMSGPSETPGYGLATDRVSVSVTGGVASVRVVSQS